MFTADINPFYIPLLHELALELIAFPPLPPGLTDKLHYALNLIPKNGYMSTDDWVLRGHGDKKISLLYADSFLESGSEYLVFKAHILSISILHDHLLTIHWHHKVIKVPQDKMETRALRHYSQHQILYNKLTPGALIASPGTVINYYPFPLSICMDRYDCTLHEAYQIKALISLDPTRPPVPLSDLQVAIFVEKILRTLHLLHQEGFIHMDVKPQNLLLKEVEGQWQCFLSDFSLIGGLGRYQELIDYPYWCPLAQHYGVMTPYTDVWGAAITLGGVIFGDTLFFLKPTEDIRDPSFQDVLREKAFQKVGAVTPFHIHIFALIVEMLSEGERLLPHCAALEPLAQNCPYRPFNQTETTIFSTLPLAIQFADKLGDIISNSGKAFIKSRLKKAAKRG